MKKSFWTAIAVVGVLLMVYSAWTLAFVGPGPGGGPLITATWAADTTCGYGFTATDCWASNESLSLNGVTLTVTVKLDHLSSGSGSINPDDVAFTFTVKNDGPPVYDAFGNEIPQPIYGQVTFVETITSDQGVPLKIVQVNSVNQEKIAFRDFADNSFITQEQQALLGTLAAGASDTAKLCINLRPQAFDAASLAVGQTYHIRGYVGQQSFDIAVYVATDA